MDIERFDKLKSSKIVMYDAFGKQVVPGDIILCATRTGILFYDIIVKLVNSGARVLNTNQIVFSRSFIASTERISCEDEAALKKKYKDYSEKLKKKMKTVCNSFFGAFVLADGIKGFCEFAVEGASSKDCFEKFTSSISKLEGFQFYALCNGLDNGSCIFKKDFTFKEVCMFKKQNTPLSKNISYHRNSISDEWISKMTKAPISSPNWKITYWRNILLVTDSMLKDFDNVKKQKECYKGSERKIILFSGLKDFEKERKDIESLCGNDSLMKDIQFAYWFKYSDKKYNIAELSAANLFNDWNYIGYFHLDYKYLKMFRIVIDASFGIKERNEDIQKSILFAENDSDSLKEDKAKALSKIIDFIKNLTYKV